MTYADLVIYLEVKVRELRESLEKHGAHIAKEEIDATGKFPTLSLVLYFDLDGVPSN
jgi:hypothetical protein